MFFQPKKIYPLIVITIFFTFIIIANYFGILINVSQSMKPGLYIKSTGQIRHGDIVAFCLPEPYKTSGLKKFYIQKGSKCDGATPLIKEVIAIPGDHINLQEHYIEVNGSYLLYRTFYQDSKGKKLEIYPRGDYQNTTGYWFIGANANNSWDSRYWGPISKNHILFKLKPLIVW